LSHWFDQPALRSAPDEGGPTQSNPVQANPSVPAKSGQIRPYPTKSDSLFDETQTNTAVKKSEMKMSLISLYFTFLHFFSIAKVKGGKETVKFLAIFDHLNLQPSTFNLQLLTRLFPEHFLNLWRLIQYERSM
jgi:hypothetical protein